MKTIAVSACLLGEKCRYDATDNKNITLLKQLEDKRVVPFCPEEYAFGSPRPTVDLIRTTSGDKAISNETGEDLSSPVIAYANRFFDAHPDINLVIGKERSPSCGVCSAKLYDEKKHLLSSSEAGLMIKEAQKRHICCIDAEDYKE
jgi:uncharacterized protein YbbK (DUF523 family)